MKTNLNKYTFLVFATTIMLLLSCGTNSDTTTTTDNTSESTVDEDMKEKMNVYVDVINSLSQDLNKGLRYYLTYVDETSGQSLNSGNIYFMPVIKNADTKLEAIEKVSKENPKAPIDAYATDYITKAKLAITLHNELAAYYDTKENLIDKNAKGLEKHGAYVAALKDFKVTSENLFKAYDEYYKAGNAQHIASLEKKGDHIRVAANKLMNEAEVLQNAFFDAIPSNETITINPALEAVMMQTSNFQKLIENYQQTVNSISKEELRKKFLGVDGRVINFGEDANDMMAAMRTMIAKLQNKETNVEYDYKKVSSKYDDMIQNFNFCKF